VYDWKPYSSPFQGPLRYVSFVSMIWYSMTYDPYSSHACCAVQSLHGQTKNVDTR
jgi:hypothetical protein